MTKIPLRIYPEVRVGTYGAIQMWPLTYKSGRTTGHEGLNHFECIEVMSCENYHHMVLIWISLKYALIYNFSLISILIDSGFCEAEMSNLSCCLF